MARPYKCPHCDSVATTSRGVRRTKTQGDRRIRFCKACKRKFTPRNQKPAEAEQDTGTDADMLASQIEAAEPELNQRPEEPPVDVPDDVPPREASWQDEHH